MQTALVWCSPDPDISVFPTVDTELSVERLSQVDGSFKSDRAKRLDGICWQICVGCCDGIRRLRNMPAAYLMILSTLAQKKKTTTFVCSHDGIMLIMYINHSSSNK